MDCLCHHWRSMDSTWFHTFQLLLDLLTRVAQQSATGFIWASYTSWFSVRLICKSGMGFWFSRQNCRYSSYLKVGKVSRRTASTIFKLEYVAIAIVGKELNRVSLLRLSVVWGLSWRSNRIHAGAAVFNLTQDRESHCTWSQAPQAKGCTRYHYTLQILTININQHCCLIMLSQYIYIILQLTVSEQMFV